MVPQQNIDPVVAELIQAVEADNTLKPEQKKMIVERLHDHSFISNIAGGAAGGSLAMLISKYLKLSSTAKVLLSVAGFGIGRALLKTVQEHDTKKFQDYNKKIKGYEIR